MSKISYTNFAKLVNVSRPAISKAVACGRLKAYGIDKRNPYLIEEEALEDWVKNTQREQYGDADKNVHIPVDAGPIDSENPTLIQSRGIKEKFKAKIEKLKYEEMSGRLVDIELAQKQYFDIARKVRDKLMAIPDRISAQLSVESDQFKIHKKIEHELRIVLRELGAENG